jgi:hypothetical protein
VGKRPAVRLSGCCYFYFCCLMRKTSPDTNVTHCQATTSSNSRQKTAVCLPCAYNNVKDILDIIQHVSVGEIMVPSCVNLEGKEKGETPDIGLYFGRKLSCFSKGVRPSLARPLTCTLSLPLFYFLCFYPAILYTPFSECFCVFHPCMILM